MTPGIEFGFKARPDWRAGRDQHGDEPLGGHAGGGTSETDRWPRFLTTFEVFAGDQMTGVSSPALAQALTAAGLPRPEQIRARLMPVFETARRWRCAAERSFVTYDAGLMLCAVLAGTLLLRLADANDAPQPRNPAADAIAARFAAASSVDGGSGDLEQRLDFATRYRLVAAQAALSAPSLDRSGGNLELRWHMPFQAEGAVVIRGLPANARLSAGTKVGGNAWALAPGDLDNLEVVLPPAEARRLQALIEVVSPEGAVKGRFAVRLVPAVAGILDTAFPVGRLDWEQAAAPSRKPQSAGGGASEIRTGAVTPAARLGASAEVVAATPAGSEASDRARVKKVKPMRRGVRKGAKSKAPTRKPTAAVAGVVPAASAAPYKPASGDGAALKETSGAGKQFLINLGVFPSNPMESEAARR